MYRKETPRKMRKWYPYSVERSATYIRSMCEEGEDEGESG